MRRWQGCDTSGRVSQTCLTMQVLFTGLRIWLSLVPAVLKEAHSAWSTQVLMDKVLV